MSLICHSEVIRLPLGVNYAFYVATEECNPATRTRVAARKIIDFISEENIQGWKDGVFHIYYCFSELLSNNFF
jgi:hypothetical protein